MSNISKSLIEGFLKTYDMPPSMVIKKSSAQEGFVIEKIQSSYTLANKSFSLIATEYDN
jgi:hypothetical protein